MRNRLLTISALCLGLAACGGGASLNPTTWFGNSGPKGVALIPPGGFDNEQDGRELVSQVIEVKVLRASGGVILHAKGLPPRLGYWDAELVSTSDEKPVKGVLSFEFRIAEPAFHTNSGQPRQREVLVGHFISDTKLQGVTSVRVVGTTNSRSARP